MAFAAAGGGLLVQQWQQREWERRTRFIVHNLVEETLGVLRFIGTTSHEIIVGALPADQRSRVHPVDPAFQLPLRAQQEESMASSETITQAAMAALSDQTTAATEHSRAAWARYQAAENEFGRASDALSAEIRGLSGSDRNDLQRDDFDPERERGEDTAQPRRAPREQINELPFEISADLRFQRAITERRRTAAGSLASASDRLYRLISDLAAYVPANAQALLKRSTSLRHGLDEASSQRREGEAPRADTDWRSGSRRRSVDSEYAAAEARLQRAEQALCEAERERDEADAEWSSATAALLAIAHILRIEEEVFALVRELDDIYRRRIREGAKGLELLPLAYSELMNIELDRQTAVINLAADSAAIAREMTAAFDESRPAEPLTDPQHESSAGPDERR